MDWGWGQLDCLRDLLFLLHHQNGSPEGAARNGGKEGKGGGPNSSRNAEKGKQL